MEQSTYILSGKFSTLSQAVIDGLLLKEFVARQAMSAGLTVVPAEASELPSKGGIFLLADADFCPDELKKVQTIGADRNVRLISERGDTLGYILDNEAVQNLDAAALSALETLVIKKSERITSENYKAICRNRQKQLHEALEKTGVFMEDGARISPLYDIAPGVFIGGQAVLAGHGTIAAGCSITGASRLTDVILEEGVSVQSCVLLDCKVGAETTVGPFAYLRPGTQIGKKARIGDFVEIKNSVIDDGTKVSHLTYVGDSDVGKGVNFGCGTVTSNYDGMHKYRTTIGDHAFIGCNTNLVAPVSVGNNVYIAAGSTITDDIPDQSLAIARQRQVTKENWVAEKKPELIK